MFRENKNYGLILMSSFSVTYTFTQYMRRAYGKFLEQATS